MRAAAEQVQRLYERGTISYPRSDSRDIGAESGAALERLVPRFAGTRPPSKGVRSRDTAPHAHEAIHPLAPVVRRLDLGIPEWMLDGDDRTVHRLARHWLRCLAPIAVDRPSTDRLPEWARDLAWTRPAGGTPKALLFPEDTGRESEFVPYPPAEIAFRALMTANLGRPSSQVDHAEHAAARGWIAHGRLSKTGRSLLEATPEALADPATSHAIETALESKHTTSPNALALAEAALFQSPRMAPLRPLLRATLAAAHSPAAEQPVESQREHWEEDHAKAERAAAASRRAADLAMEAWIEAADAPEPVQHPVAAAVPPPVPADSLVLDESPCRRPEAPSIR